jgi:hypothetical protein
MENSKPQAEQKKPVPKPEPVPEIPFSESLMQINPSDKSGNRQFILND